MPETMDDGAFETCIEEIAEWVYGSDIGIRGATTDDYSDPRESGSEEECQESESNEDKNISYLSSGLGARTATDMLASEMKLNSILYLRISTPPPELA